MATNTYIALTTQTVASPVSSVTFSSIPQDYTDLVIEISALATSNGVSPLRYRINGSSANYYSETVLVGTGSSVVSGRNVAFPNFSLYWFNYLSSTTPRLVTINIPNYSNTVLYKNILTRFSDSSAEVGAFAQFYYSPSPAVTTLEFYTTAGTIAAGSTFTIYGIAKSSIGAKATGGSIYSDENYFYHIFNSTGTFTPLQSLSCEYLVVAGGGGGGNGNPQATGGGGGQVGYATNTLTAGSYTATVGAGGAGTVAGSSSAFNGLTMSGGGRGQNGYYPDRGGSSGKNINGVVTSYLGGLTTSGVVNNQLAGGGGAGAGANGLDSSPFNPAVVGSIGGDGYASNITGELIYYGGGGNGGNEGTGSNSGWGSFAGYVPTYRSKGGGGWGGGQYPSSNPASKPTAGETNTGGGGGGGTWDNSNPKETGADFGAAGGSGIVIVRYAR